MRAVAVFLLLLTAGATALALVGGERNGAESTATAGTVRRAPTRVAPVEPQADTPLPEVARTPAVAPPRAPRTRTLARGIVTDDAGRPVSGARIRAELPFGAEASGTARDGSAWSASCLSADDGGFALDGTLGEGPIVVTASHPRFAASRATRCAAGETGLVLQLYGGSCIVGRIELDPALPTALFVVSASGPAPASSTYQGTLAGDGTFQLLALPSGTYEVVVALEHEPRTALVLPETEVSTNRVARLDPVDLRGRVVAFQLSLRDRQGDAPTNCFVRRRLPGAADFDRRIQPVRDGEALIATFEPCVDLRIESPRYRAEVVEGVSTDIEVVLGSASRVQLVLEDGFPSRAPDLQLAASLEPTDASSGTYGRVSLFDARGIAETQVDEPGNYNVRVYAWRAGPHGTSSLLSNRVEARITIPEQAFVSSALRLSDETLARIDTESGPNPPPLEAPGHDRGSFDR